MLNGGTLDGAHLTVHSDVEHPDADDHETSADIGQHDKPRAGSKHLCL